MSLTLWNISYLLHSTFWVWVVFFKGAEFIHSLEVNFLSWTFLGWMPDWDVDFIKFIGWVMLILSTIWFIFGIFEPELRTPWHSLRLIRFI